MPLMGSLDNSTTSSRKGSGDSGNKPDLLWRSQPGAVKQDEVGLHHPDGVDQGWKQDRIHASIDQNGLAIPGGQGQVIDHGATSDKMSGRIHMGA